MEYFIYIGTLIAIYATLTISLNLLVGYTGLISIAQAGIYGVGAYTTALLALHVTNNLLISFVIASSAGVLVSLIVALPSLRLKNEYFLIATMGFQAIIFSMFMNLEITGGASGLYDVPHPTLFGYTIRTSYEKFLIALALAVICYVLALRITNAPFGRLLRAVREDQIAVAALGKSVFRVKFSIFVFSAVFAAAAGTIYVYSLTALDPVAFGLDESIFIITLVIVGGTGSLNGSVLAAALLILLPETFKFLAIPEVDRTAASPGALRRAARVLHPLSPARPDRRIPRRAEVGAQMTNGALLRLEALSKSFGGLQAVSNLSFDVKAGTITSLIGGNGAGKTTAFNLITGNLAPDAGHIYFRDERVDGLPPHRVARAGIARGFQELRLFNRLSARDNIEAAIPNLRGESIVRALIGGRGLRDERLATDARSNELLRELTIDSQADVLAERLSYGQQKLLSLGRLLAAEGELLLLDEPTSGLSPHG